MNIDLIIIFENCINPLCTCSLEVQSTAHFFLHCHHYHNIRAKLLNSLEVIDTNLLKLSEEQLTKVFLCGLSQLDQNQNRNILNSTINFGQYKKLPWDKFVRWKRTFRKLFRNMEYFWELQRLVDDLVDFLELLMFINAYIQDIIWWSG